MKDKLSLRHKILLVSAATSLILGLLNYFLFRPNIYLFRFISIRQQNIFELRNHFIGHFLAGYFSDIMWCFALYMVTVVLSERSLLHFLGKMLILALPFAVETAQYLGWINGTFDWYDLLTYAFILLLFLIFFSSLNPIKNETK